MYPYEMLLDSNGIGYIDLDKINFPLYETKFNDYKFRSKSIFYMFPSTGIYLMKINKNNAINGMALYEMIKNLLLLQSKNPTIDFPIGYVKDSEKIVGQIIYNYERAKSLKMIYNNEDLVSLQKHCYLDEDVIHNLFLIYLQILNKLENLLDNGVLYLDIHAGNFVFYNNDIKIIDFDPKYMGFRDNLYFKDNLINNYINMVNRVNYEFGLDLGIFESYNDISFKDAREKIIKLENTIRKNNCR